MGAKGGVWERWRSGYEVGWAEWAHGGEEGRLVWVAGGFFRLRAVDGGGYSTCGHSVVNLSKKTVKIWRRRRERDKNKYTAMSLVLLRLPLHGCVPPR